MRPTIVMSRLTCTAFACLIAATPARAATVAPVAMRMTSSSESCILGCTDAASYSRSVDSTDAPESTFAPITVQTAVASGANAFAASALGVTTLLGDTGFRVEFNLARPAVGTTTGSYAAGAHLSFSFVTDATPDRVLSVAYAADFVRPVTGSELDAGVSLGPAFHIPVAPANASSGVPAGSWTFHLLPNRFYSGTISAGIGASWVDPEGLGADELNVVFTVAMPAFAQPVPEPQTWGLMLSGAVLLAPRLRRRARRVDA